MYDITILGRRIKMYDRAACIRLLVRDFYITNALNVRLQTFIIN